MNPSMNQPDFPEFFPPIIANFITKEVMLENLFRKLFIYCYRKETYCFKKFFLMLFLLLISCCSLQGRIEVVTVILQESDGTNSDGSGHSARRFNFQN